MTDLSIKNLSYVDNFKHTVMGNFANFKGLYMTLVKAVGCF